jgi:UDP-N-acetylmuramyl pentapeptide phosphotransferase/UDP-N-acetylglucosamine-1-phosphate transferase
MAALILVFLTSFIVVLYSTPALIKVAVLKRLIDAPTEERKIHKRSVPTIG